MDPPKIRAITTNRIIIINIENFFKCLILFKARHIVIKKNIDTPEELHFFYINVLQNGKELEGKFEVTNSINP